MASPTSLINHIALSVPNIEDAAKWYEEVFGMKLLFPIMACDRETMPDTPIFSVFPPTMKSFRVAFMSAGQGTALELFEFKDPKMELAERYSFARDFNRGGFGHVGITTQDAEALCEQVVLNGGKKVGATMPLFQYKACYVEDKWGNIFELMEYTLETVVKLIKDHAQAAA